MFSLTLLLFAAQSLCAQKPAAISFEKDVVPLLQKHCFACHNSEDRKGEFAIQTKAEAFDLGYIEPGDPAASH
ncbi:MAG: hypothetical protein MKZ95_18400, partial [Pirellulales bacterium]|nr:hypothetical protein [Pirellulales bacterium]